MRALPLGLAVIVMSAGSVLAVQAGPSSASGQSPSTRSGQGPSTGSGQSTQAPAQTAAETFSYQPDGRRDPFLSLVGTGSDPRSSSSRKTEGPAGMTLAEISVRGIMQSRGTLVAMIQGPDNKTYIVHQGDKLLDGIIKTITPQGLIVVQEVNDPLSLVKQREIRKLLRSLEGAKE
jgi:Tfp pilus assembly protein PilP